jgi:uncharacterized membrane protein
MQQHDDAPDRARRDDKDGELAIVGRSVLINKPRQEVYAFWRDFSNLPRFMRAVDTIETEGSLTRWTVKAPVGQTVTLVTEVTEDVPGSTIAWRSTDESDIKTEGRVTFADAPGDRGTAVTADIRYEPPAGNVGRLAAKLFGAEPNIQARHELKRFKMLLEAGEVATAINHHDQENND